MISVRIFSDFLKLLFIAFALSPASSDIVPTEEFGQNILSTITKYLDDEKSSDNSEIANNIKNDLFSSTFSTEYFFAVAIYDDISELSGNDRIAKEGNNVFTFSKNGKNALVIANPKSTNSQGYKKCEFWNFLFEDEICGKPLNNVIEMIKNKCNGITDLAVIKMIPNSLDGYVSPEFDADAFSVSGFGLGECFHYSIWVANAIA